MKIFGALVLKSFAVMACAWLAIWWAYSMKSRISGGYFSSGEARLLTAQMASIVCLLLLPVQALAPYMRRKRSKLWITFGTFGAALAVLLLYPGFVWWWREHWDISKGLSENAAFGPVLGHLNATFLSGFDGLAYAVGVAPPVSAIAAVLVLVGPQASLNHHQP
jgi:hypothetical protein